MNIGNLIITFLENKNLPQAYLAKELNMPTSNLSRLLKRESMDTDKLLDISIKLKHNFFADICGDEINGENLSLTLVPVGRQIENRLKELKITQSKFAVLLDVTPAEISRLLKKTSFDVLKLLKISSILDYNFFQDFYESNLEENKGIIKRYIENNLFSASAAATPQTLDMDFERKLLASQLVSEVRRTPDHLSLTLTGDGVLAFVEALQTFAIENSSSTPENGHLFPKMNDDLIAKKDVMEGLGVTHTTLWKWEKNGYLIPVKVGKRVYYKREDLEKLTK